MNTAVHKRAAGVHSSEVLPSNDKILARTERRRNRRKRKYRDRGCRSSMISTSILLSVLSVGVCLGCYCYYYLSPYSTSSSIHRPRYNHSDSMPHIGDKSIPYSELRREFDSKLPSNSTADTSRIRSFVKSLHRRTYLPLHPHDTTYDIHDCPVHPPPDYPFSWNIGDVLTNWPPDDPSPRRHVHQGICVFDYETQGEHALNYRAAEVPYVMRNDPKVMRTVERWNQPGYMERMLGKEEHRTEYSPDNHFMYWANAKAAPQGWKPPTKMMKMPYLEWLEHANFTDRSKIGPDMEHWYYRLIGCGEWRKGKCDQHSSEYLFDELPFFQPRDDNKLYMVKPKKQAGIHCRFGMNGVIAENHFDGSRNMVALLGGERRYILSHPDQCENLALYPKGHPSSRHSAVDWSDPDWKKFPRFRDAHVNEVVLQAGDVLYIPTYWFHYIISLDLNFQCNTRSGVSQEYHRHIDQCGF